MPPEFIELAPRSDGARLRRVRLSIERDGALMLNELDLGAHELAAWGLDVEEVTLTVPREAVGRLAAALAAEILSGGQGAVARLRGICEREDVPCRIASWT
jgi:hypothetical protein